MSGAQHAWVEEWRGAWGARPALACIPLPPSPAGPDHTPAPPRQRTRLGAAGAAGALVRRGAGDGGDQQALHPDTRVVHLAGGRMFGCGGRGGVRRGRSGQQRPWGRQPPAGLAGSLPARSRRRMPPGAGEYTIAHLLFGKAGINHVHDAINGQRRLCNVGRHDDFAAGGAAGPRRRRRRVKDALLLLGRERGVEGVHLDGPRRIAQVGHLRGWEGGGGGGGGVKVR